MPSLAGSGLPAKKANTKTKDEQRNYKHEWQAGRPWLEGRANHERSKQIMAFCLACRSFIQNRESGLKAHAETEKHIGNMKVWSKQPEIQAFVASTVHAVHRVSE